MKQDQMAKRTKTKLHNADYMCDMTFDVGSNPPPAHVLIYKKGGYILF